MRYVLRFIFSQNFLPIVPSKTNGTGTTEYPHSEKKNEVEPLSHIIGKKLIKMNQRAKNTRRKHRGKGL